MFLQPFSRIERLRVTCCSPFPTFTSCRRPFLRMLARVFRARARERLAGQPKVVLGSRFCPLSFRVRCRASPEPELMTLRTIWPVSPKSA
jgi:hypothetical protein